MSQLIDEFKKLLARFERCARHAGNSDEVIADATASARAALAAAQAAGTDDKQQVQAAAEWAYANGAKCISPAWEGDSIDWHAIARGMLGAIRALSPPASAETKSGDYAIVPGPVIRRLLAAVKNNPPLSGREKINIRDFLTKLPAAGFTSDQSAEVGVDASEDVSGSQPAPLSASAPTGVPTEEKIGAAITAALNRGGVRDAARAVKALLSKELP